MNHAIAFSMVVREMASAAVILPARNSARPTSSEVLVRVFFSRAPLVATSSSASVAIQYGLR